MKKYYVEVPQDLIQKETEELFNSDSVKAYKKENE